MCNMGFAIVSGRFFQVQLGWIAFFLSRSSSSGIVQQNYITLKFKDLFEPVVQYMGRLEQARYSHHVLSDSTPTAVIMNY